MGRGSVLRPRGPHRPLRYGEAVEARQHGTGPGPGRGLRAARALYDPLVYRRIRNALGGRVRYVICGGSPLGRRLAAFYAGAGIEIFEGYGLTETTAAATVTPPLRPRLGTVGWPLPGTRVRIAADGEVLLSGDHVFRGYWDPHGGRCRRRRAPTAGSPPATSAHSTTDGYLTITGRKKEILITAGGKNVAPAPLEDWLRSHPLIAQCMVVGDRRPYISALITLDPDGRHPLAPDERQARRAPPNSSSTTRSCWRSCSARSTRRTSWSPAPSPSAGSPSCPAEFTEEAGHLTPSMKLRRAAMLKEFAQEIEALYVR